MLCFLLYRAPPKEGLRFFCMCLPPCVPNRLPPNLFSHPLHLTAAIRLPPHPLPRNRTAAAILCRYTFTAPCHATLCFHTFHTSCRAIPQPPPLRLAYPSLKIVPAEQSAAQSPHLLQHNPHRCRNPLLPNSLITFLSFTLITPPRSFSYRVMTVHSHQPTLIQPHEMTDCPASRTACRLISFRNSTRAYLLSAPSSAIHLLPLAAQPNRRRTPLLPKLFYRFSFLDFRRASSQPHLSLPPAEPAAPINKSAPADPLT